MNEIELRAARMIARNYRRGLITLRALHNLAEWRAKRLTHAAPQVWLSVVMQMAKGPAGVI